jgi:tetratricopeptide (TPR) repeat protein
VNPLVQEVDMKKTWLLIPAAAAVLLAVPARAQHEHTHGDAETLGTVHFPTSCRPEVTAAFTRATALLHSFGYEESRKGFEDVARRDPKCGIAYWGVAMTYYHPIWSPPTAAELAAGRAAADKAAEVGAKTDRERAYIAAIGAFYREADPRARAQAFRQAMEDVSRRFPADDEAAIFHALTLLATAPPSDATFGNQKKAALILNGLLPRHPDHPGIAHYVIHSFDYPALANDALPAARAYAKIAPSSPHALHMPSHIFTRLGLWPESIASNIDSAEAGRRLVARTHPGATAFDTLHALDYLEYAYLQVDDQAKARAVLEEAAKSKTFDEPNFAAAYALAAVPARWALERRDWKAAAALELPAVELPWAQYAYVPAITYFARAIGAARSGQAERAREAVAKLQAVQAGLAKSPPPGPYDWAGQVEAMRLAAAGIVARVEGRDDEALRLLRSGAELDEKTGKHPVTPGAVLPPRELLADVLLETGRAAEALAEYETSLREAPNRFNSLAGAARAAERAGKPERAAELYGRLIDMTVKDAQRPELQEARKVVAAKR